MLKGIRSLVPVMRFQCINSVLGSSISSYQKEYQQKLTMHGKSLTAAGFKTAGTVASAVNTKAIMVKTPTRQFSKCIELMDKKNKWIKRFNDLLRD